MHAPKYFTNGCTMSPLDGSQSNDANREGRKPRSANRSARLSRISSNSAMLKDVGELCNECAGEDPAVVSLTVWVSVIMRMDSSCEANMTRTCSIALM